MNHPIFPVACPSNQGTLLLTPCPGTMQDSTEAVLQILASKGSAAVITLMQQEELAQHNVLNIASIAANLGMQWFHLPIEDEGAPTEEFEAQWAVCKKQVHALLDDNKAVVIHCKGGSGRTGVVAAQILLERGMALEESVNKIKSLRPNAFSHKVQVDYIHRSANQINSH